MVTTSNNETVSHQMPWAGNFTKIMTSNGKQFTVTCKMLTTVAHDRWNLSAVFKFCFCFVLLITNHLMTQISMFPSTLSWETLRFSGNKIHCSPWDQSLYITCTCTSHLMSPPFLTALSVYSNTTDDIIENLFLKVKRVCWLKVINHL